MTRQLILTNKRPRSVHLTRSVRRTAGFVQVGLSSLMKPSAIEPGTTIMCADLSSIERP